MTMNRTIHAIRALALPLLLLFSLSACALGRDVVDITPPTITATDAKAFAKIVSVEDLRVFEAAPTDAGTPSLQDAKDITDKNITARALARKRGGFGAALGDIVLPEGKTVAGLIRSAAAKALRDKGYAVVDKDAPQYADALPLNIEIKEFWAWFAPGAFSVNLDFQSTLKLSGDALVGANPPPVSNHLHQDALAATDGTWADLIQRGLNDTSDKIKDALKAPPDRPQGRVGS